MPFPLFRPTSSPARRDSVPVECAPTKALAHDARPIGARVFFAPLSHLAAVLVSTIGLSATAPAPARAAPLECRLIDCDCDHVDAGLLTKAYRRQCRDAEAKARESCETGKPQLY